MGFGNGMAIGWPNATYNANSGGIFNLSDCSDNQITLYSDSDFFLPGIIVYVDSEKTDTYIGTPGQYWNLPHLILTLGGYEVSPTNSGEVLGPLTTCPT